MTFSNKTDNLIPFESRRTISKFAFLPVTINETTKWLERISVIQEYQVSGAADVSFSGWVNIKFK